MPIIDSRLLDGHGEMETTENFNRVLSIVDTMSGNASAIDAEQEVGTPVNAVAASVDLTIATQPTADETMTIGSKVYTFVDTPAEDGDIALGADLAAVKLNVVAAINGTGEGQVCTAHPDVTCAAFSGNVAVLTAKVRGEIGNAIAVAETFAAEGNLFATETLEGGINGTVAPMGSIRTDGTALYVATADNGIHDANWKSVTLT